LVSGGFDPDELSIRGVTPEVSSVGAEESPGQAAEQDENLAGIIALKSSLCELKEKALEGLFRMRLGERSGISLAHRQCAPSTLAKQLKTIELHLEPTLNSQIESRE
jgi:hypothetical protein